MNITKAVQVGLKILSPKKEGPVSDAFRRALERKG